MFLLKKKDVCLLSSRPFLFLCTELDCQTVISFADGLHCPPLHLCCWFYILNLLKNSWQGLTRANSAGHTAKTRATDTHRWTNIVRQLTIGLVSQGFNLCIAPPNPISHYCKYNVILGCLWCSLCISFIAGKNCWCYSNVADKELETEKIIRWNSVCFHPSISPSFPIWLMQFFNHLSMPPRLCFGLSFISWVFLSSPSSSSLLWFSSHRFPPDFKLVLVSLHMVASAHTHKRASKQLLTWCNGATGMEERGFHAEMKIQQA